MKCMAIHLDHMDIVVLNQIEEDHPNDSKQRVMYTMKEWLQRETEPSWAKIVGGLWKINRNVLATEIVGKYCAPMTMPHLLEPLSSHSASLESQPTATASSTESSVHSLEHIAMPSQDEATCSPVDEILAIKNKAAMLQTNVFSYTQRYALWIKRKSQKNSKRFESHTHISTTQEERGDQESQQC